MILQRIISGTKETVLEKIVLIILRFFEPLVFLTFSSLNNYGIWIIIFSLPAYLMMSDLGVSAVGQNQINMDIKKKKYLLANENFNYSLTLIVILNIFFSILYYLIFINLFKNNLINLNEITLEQFSKILLCVIFYTFINQIYGLIIAVFSAINLFHLKVRYGYINKILELLTILICLKYNFNFTTILINFIIIKLLFIFIIGVQLKGKCSWLKYKFLINLSYIKKFWFIALSYLILPLTNSLKYQTLLLMINNFLGAKTVAIFSIYLTLSRICVAASSLTDGILKIELAKLWISRKIEKLTKIFIFNLQNALIISLTITLSVIILKNQIFNFWLSNQVPVKIDVLILLMMAGLFQSLLNCSINFQISTNNIKNYAFFNLFLSILFTIFILFILRMSQGLTLVAVIISLGIIIEFLVALKFSSVLLEKEILNLFLRLFSITNYKTNIIYIKKNVLKK